MSCRECDELDKTFTGAMPTRADIFVKYLTGVLVETGSNTGGGITESLKAGFKRVISIEIQPSFYALCSDMFKDKPNVKLILGDSALELGKAIQDIDEPITFWLDGHFSGNDTGFGIKGAPILEELEHIRKHPLAGQHTIMIDDRRMLQKTGLGGRDTYFELTEDEVIAKLREINPNYTFCYEDGYIAQDVLVAIPPTNHAFGEATTKSELYDVKHAVTTFAVNGNHVKTMDKMNTMDKMDKMNTTNDNKLFGYIAYWTTDPYFEFNGQLRLWRMLEDQLRVVVDVGTGQDLTFPDNGRVIQHCFEPEPSFYEVLSVFERPHIHISKLALGTSTQANRTFWKHGESLHRRAAFGCPENCSCKITVDVITLDDYCAKNQIEEIDLLNLSPAGNECEVLEGGKRILQKTRLVMFEYGGTYTDSGTKVAKVLKLLLNAGLASICLINATSLIKIDDIKENYELGYFIAARSYAELARMAQGHAAIQNIKPVAVRFEMLPSLVPTVSVHALDTDPTGFNLSLWSKQVTPISKKVTAVVNQKVSNVVTDLAEKASWIGTLRRKGSTNEKGKEPDSICSILHFDQDFKVLKRMDLQDRTVREKPSGCLTGLEDCRLIDDMSLLAVTHDTNPKNHAQISFVRFSLLTNIISDIQPLIIEGIDPDQTQKNWLLLRQWGDELHLLQNYNPWRVVRVNSKSGKGSILKEESLSNLNLKAHGGAAVELPDHTFLVTIREYRRRYYAGSRWLHIDAQYNLIGISPIFRFQNELYYEMCMSLTLRPPYVVAALSLEDRVLQIHTFLLASLLYSTH